MSWQRIDENTYIDDTLVTCAEYQLFIDEMREQGKYHQPDHWTSYQFATGQARGPILGVRQSDAGYFCQWLSKRVGGEWKYRVPTQREARNYPIESVPQAPVGYWILGAEDQSRFTWLGIVPLDARGITLALVSGLDESINHIFGSNNPHDLQSNNPHDLQDALDIIRARAFDRSHMFERPLDISEVGSGIHLASPGSRIAPDRAIDLRSARDHILDGTQINLINRAFVYALDTMIFSSNSMEKTSPFTFKRMIASKVDHYLDIFVLLERIAGRSPAFEGIRLVKERIK